jgi:hypothetical protein
MPNAKIWTPRRIRSEDERGSGSSDYIQLDEGEKFLGYALFEGDPSLDDPGYYEYAEHYDPSIGKRGGSVPCAGPDDCIYCQDGDRPKTRAKTLWLVVEDQKKNELDPPQLRIFNFNFNIIKAVTEMRAEGEKIKGRQFRVSRLDDRGNYTLLPKAESLKATELKEWLKNDSAPDFDKMVTAQLRKAMEGAAIRKAVEDPDEEPEEEKPAAKAKTKPAATKTKAKPKAEWPDEIEETVTVVSADGSGAFFTASSDDYDGTKDVYKTDAIEFDLTDLAEDDLVKITASLDGEGDYVLSEEPETEGAESEEADSDAPDNDLPDSIDGVEFEVVDVNAPNSTIDVKNEELEFTLYFLDTMTIDFDDYAEGDTIIVSAEKDSFGDEVATEVPKKKGAAKKKTATGRKTAAK